MPVQFQGFSSQADCPEHGTGVEHINQEERRAGCIYFHPREIDTEQPRSRTGAGAWWRHSIRRSRREKKLRRLLGDFEFAPKVEPLRTIGGSSERLEYSNEEVNSHWENGY